MNAASTSSTKRSADDDVASLANSTDASQKKTKADDQKATTTSPYERYFDTQNEWMDQRKHILGMQLVQGIPSHETQDDDKSLYTTEQMNNLRFIMITQNRADLLDQMNHLILGDQAQNNNEGFLFFRTSFSYGVLDSWQVVKKQLARNKAHPAQKLDILMAYTSILHEHDHWMHDNEGDMNVLVKGLASAWKKLLKHNDDETLGWDLEYTKPGVLCLLEQFKSQIEGYDSYYGLGKFKYM